MDAETPIDRTALETAVEYVHQWRLQSWTLEQNRKGITPSTAAVLAEFESRRLQQPDGSKPKAWGSSEQGGARMRVSRWRQMFNGRFGKLKVRELVPTEILRNKVFRVCLPLLPPFPSLIRPPSHPPPIRPSFPMSVAHATFLSKPDRITRLPHGASAGEYENTIPRRAHLARNMRSENGPKPGPFFDLAVCFLN